MIAILLALTLRPHSAHAWGASIPVVSQGITYEQLASPNLAPIYRMIDERTGMVCYVLAAPSGIATEISCGPIKDQPALPPTSPASH